MIGGAEVMEVMMTGGDGSAMTEDTLAQVVNMLQTEGQLTGGNHTIIIRQPGSDEIQMIQTTSNGGELVVTKASAEEIQALQAANVSQELLEAQQGGQVVMMDEGVNLVEGMVQMQDSEEQQAVGDPQVHINENGQIPAVQDANLNTVVSKSVTQPNEMLEGFVSMPGVDGPTLLSSELQPPDPPPSSKGQVPITITTNAIGKRAMSPPSNKVVSIKINTGIDKKREAKKLLPEPANVIKISTVTGRQKTQPPKFHKCESCTINFVSKVAYMNHMENCPSKRKTIPPLPSKGNVTYTCVFCETKFNSRLVLMQHVRNCDKARATKSQSVSKPKAATTESKLKIIGSPLGKEKNSSLKRKRAAEKNNFKMVSKKSFMFDDEDEVDVDNDLESDYDDDKDIPYDDDEDLNDQDLMVDDELDDAISQGNKNSQKHLGPILTKGMFKCRDCSRTFSKENQYNRHLKGCTNAPLNVSRVVKEMPDPDSHTGEYEVQPMLGIKRKRGRPPKGPYGDAPTPKKKKLDVPKIVSIDPKKVSLASRKMAKKTFSDGESEDESDYLSSSSLLQNDDDFKKKSPRVSFSDRSRPNKPTGALSKIVKISPSDTLIKKTGKAILSKMNQQQKSKISKDSAFYCGLCGDKFKAIADLALHTQACHSEDVLNTRDLLDGKGSLASVKCPLCDFNFVSSHTLLFHMVSYHSKELKNVNEELETLNLNLLCPFCNLTCPSQELFKEHLATSHLEKLTNRPSASLVPISIDVNALIREKNNGSILPTAKLLSKQEKVLCPDCGLFLLKSYFEHHRCAAESYSPSSRKFVCSEIQCGGMTFYKLIHLLTHLQQVHDKTLPCQNLVFESMNQFIDWLKKEESKSKNKFTKALQRMKQGKLNAVWICHRFHSVVKDPSQGQKDDNKKIDRLRQCYSRIHAETCFNASTSRYDGKTIVKYYPDHKHIDTMPSPKKTLTPPKADAPTTTQQKAEFNDAAELKELLDDEGDSQKETLVEPETASVAEGAESEETTKEPESNQEEEAGESNSPVEEESAAAESESAVILGDKEEEGEESEKGPNEENEAVEGDSSESVKDAENIEEAANDDASSSSAMDVSGTEKPTVDIEIPVEEEKKDPSPVSFSDAELPEDLLEKMLGDAPSVDDESVALSTDSPKDDTTTQEVKLPETDKDIPSMDENTADIIQTEDALAAPIESKITDVDMLEDALGVNTEDSLGTSIGQEENSSTSTASTTQQSSSSQDAASRDTEPEENKDTEEENTYVLPADVEEWKKLFELVHSQIDSESLSGDELTKARELIVYENKITEIPIEKQVEVFNKLCSIANVQMT